MLHQDPLLLPFFLLQARDPSRLLAVSEHRSWSVEDVVRCAKALSERLGEFRWAPGACVGLATPPGPAFLAGYVALRMVGLVPILCDSVSPSPDRLQALDQLRAVGFLWTQSGWPASIHDWVVSPREPGQAVELDPGLGVIKLTSGSTGEPRGVLVSAEALAADDEQLRASMGLRPDERILVAIPLAHSYGFSSLVLPALRWGAQLVFPEQATPLAALQAGRSLGATFFPTVPSVLAAWVQLRDPVPWPASVRLTIAAGAPLIPEVASRFRERTGRFVHVFYGASECGGISFDREGDAALRGTVGTWVDGVAGEIEPETGRLRVRSAAVARSYWPDPAPELSGGTFLTGDLVSIEGDELRLLGRADELINVRGRKVQPREVEAVIRRLPGVVDACVLGVDGPDGPRSQLCAVVAAPEGALTAQEVFHWCRAHLAEYKVPRSVVRVSELPRTQRGKLDRKALLALHADGKVEGET